MDDVIRVLYVDDEPGLLELGQLFLEESGKFRVGTSASAREALTFPIPQAYDAIVSDYQMPEMDGIAFLKEVRRRFGDIPFILFTGRGREEVVIEAINNGADFYIQKGGDPVTQFAELAHTIRHAVQMRQTKLTLAEQNQRYHDLQNASDLIQSVGPDGHYLFVNKKWLDTLGYTENDLPRLTVADVVHEECLGHCMDTFRRVISGESVGIIEATFKTRDGKKVWVEGMANCKMQDGVCQYTRGLFKDVTSRKKAEQELLRKNEELSAINEELRATDEELRTNCTLIQEKEQALRESTETFRAVVEQSNEGVIIVDFTGKLLYANHRASEIVDNTGELDTTGAINVLEFVAPESRKSAIQAFSEVAQGRDRFLVNYKITSLAGRERWLECIGRKISYKGSPAMLLSFRDVTERQHAQQELARVHEEVRQGLTEEKLISDFSQFLLTATSVEEVLDAFEEIIFSQSGADYLMLAKLDPVKDTIKIHSLKGFGPLLEQIGRLISVAPTSLNVPVDVIKAQQDRVPLELGLKRLTGGIATISRGYLPKAVCVGIETILQVKTIYINELVWEGNMYGSISFGFRQDKDIRNTALISTLSNLLANALWRLYSADVISSERRFLAEREEMLRLLFEDMVDGLVHGKLLYDGSGNPEDMIFLQTNRNFSLLTGLENVVGKRMSELGFAMQVLNGHLFEIFCRVEESGIPESLENPVKSQERWLNISVFSPKREHVVAVFHDITDRRRAEEALRQANRKLNLLSGITRHDITNQLMTLDGFVSLLRKKIPDPSFEPQFTRISAASRQIRDMINFTKEYEEIGVRAPAWQDLRSLADGAGGDARHGHVTLINDLPARIEIFADPLITKVFFNLVDNALRYGGKITKIRFLLEERDGNRVIVCEDDGVGVGADEKERIFELGFGKNTGFGLAISREVLDITGLTIQENGMPGQGARFEITVPAGQYRSTE